jgi:hypothetical protein
MDNLSQNVEEDSLVIFMHVPKTAGTSLRHIVQSQFQPHNVFEFYHLKTQPPKVCKGIEVSIKTMHLHYNFTRSN